MIKILSLGCVVFGLIILSACGSSGKNNSPSTLTASSSSSSSSSGGAYTYLGQVQRNLSIASAITKITYPYHVYLPYNYSLSAKSYPIIYGTDGQWVFGHFSQTLDAKHKDVIFVAIEEGALNSNRRFVDYMGVGTTDYIKFLKTEFAPMIENTYRANGERTYVGTSLGGLFGGILLTQEPVGEPYFKNYMLFDGSFFAYDNASIAVEEARFKASKQLNITLVLSSANSPGNEADVNTYQDRYESRQYEGLKIYRRTYAIAHNDVANPSFDDTIDFLF